jgi:hypothetical protein
MAIFPFVLGGLGAVALFKIARHRRHGCGRHGGGWHGHGGWHGRHGGGMPLWFLARRLELSGGQRDALIGVGARLHDALGGRRAALHQAAQAIASESFDRAKADALFTEKKAPLLDALEQVHDILTDDQRAKLHTLLGVEAPPKGAAGGPYRT